MQNFKSKITKIISIIGLVGLLALVTTACANKKEAASQSLQQLMSIQTLLKILLENMVQLRQLLVKVVLTHMILIQQLLMLRS